MNHKPTAMILAAGLGTRLKELTQDKPKALVEINGKTLLQRTIETLISNGFQRIVINVHHFGGQIISFVDSHHFNAEIIISDEREQLMDTGGGIIKASSLFTETQAILIHNVDILSSVDLKTFYQDFIGSHDDAWLLTQDRETARKLLFNNEKQLIGWKNKNTEQYKWVDGSRIDYQERAFSGMHIFRPELFADFELKPCSIIDLYLHLSKSKSIISKDIQPEFWFDLGKKEQFESIQSYLINH